ncbi:MAG: EcsC family protein [Pseudomonadota bacterium]
MSKGIGFSDLDADLAEIAQRYRKAGGLGMQVLNLLGGQAENLLDRLPEPVRARLGEATEKALEAAVRTAEKSRGIVPDQASWLNTAAATAMGAAGGMGGLPSALAELPVTTTVLFRAIQGIAAEYGYDPADPQIQAECLHVFSSAGPLAHDDGADTGFLSARVTLTGGALQGIISRIAPRLSAAMGQKLAAQTVPVLGAIAGAATNFAYTSYYQEMAHVHFALKRAAEAHDVPRATLIAQLAGEMKRKG